MQTKHFLLLLLPLWPPLGAEFCPDALLRASREESSTLSIHEVPLPEAEGGDTEGGRDRPGVHFLLSQVCSSPMLSERTRDLTAFSIQLKYLRGEPLL